MTRKFKGLLSALCVESGFCLCRLSRGNDADDLVCAAIAVADDAQIFPLRETENQKPVFLLGVVGGRQRGWRTRRKRRSAPLQTKRRASAC